MKIVRNTAEGTASTGGDTLARYSETLTRFVTSYRRFEDACRQLRDFSGSPKERKELVNGTLNLASDALDAIDSLEDSVQDAIEYAQAGGMESLLDEISDLTAIIDEDGKRASAYHRAVTARLSGGAVRSPRSPKIVFPLEPEEPAEEDYEEIGEDDSEPVRNRRIEDPEDEEDDYEDDDEDDYEDDDEDDCPDQDPDTKRGIKNPEEKVSLGPARNRRITESEDDDDDDDDDCEDDDDDDSIYDYPDPDPDTKPGIEKPEENVKGSVQNRRIPDTEDDSPASPESIRSALIEESNAISGRDASLLLDDVDHITMQGSRIQITGSVRPKKTMRGRRVTKYGR